MICISLLVSPKNEDRKKETSLYRLYLYYYCFYHYGFTKNRGYLAGRISFLLVLLISVSTPYDLFCGGSPAFRFQSAVRSALLVSHQTAQSIRLFANSLFLIQLESSVDKCTDETTQLRK